MEENLKKLLNTLNQIEVKGEGNLNRLLGSIQFIQALINDLKADSSAPENAKFAEAGEGRRSEDKE